MGFNSGFKGLIIFEQTYSKCLGRRSARLKASHCTGQHRHWKKQKCIHATNGIRTYDPNVPAAEGRARFTYNGHWDRVLRQQVVEKHCFHFFDVESGVTDQIPNNLLTDWPTNEATEQPTNKPTN